MKTIKNLFSYLLLSVILILNVQCQDGITEKQIVKVDFDFSGRKLDEVNDPNYEPWVITEQKEVEKTFGDVKVRLKGNFKSNWFKVGMSAPYYNRLGSDGLITADTLEMTISGLKKGKHSLLTFHNTLDKIEVKMFPDISIFVNNKLTDSIKPSNRALTKEEIETSYITFKAETGKDVVVRFEIKFDTKYNTHFNSLFYIQQLIINGFEIDTPNIKKQATVPFPESGDEHIEIKDTVKLQWQASKDAKFHLLYFGDNEANVSKANENSPEFKGKLDETKFSIENMYSGTRYYWRVDEVDNDGNISEGNVWWFKPAQLAFPGAEGYGRFAVGGRGGKVVEVTNLNDDGLGSIRNAVNQNIGPRTIVFNVSGNIQLKSRLVVNQPYITIAGQTAPGDGITISRAPVGLTGDDGIIQFLKVRIGAGTTYDGMGLTGADYSIIDHCSISWTIDESFSSRGAHHITLQHTLISEALNVAGHDKYEANKMHGYAATIGGDVGSFHHNLLAHNYGRNWSMGGGLNGDGYYSGRLDIRNNVVYNWGHRTTDGGANEVNFVNNYYKPGKSSDIFFALNAQHEGVGKGRQQYYFEGNVMPGYFNEKTQEKGRTFKLTNKAVVDYETFVDAPFFESYVNTQTANQAYKNVLSDVGATQPFFDNHDVRIINETLKGTYSFKGSKSGLSGMIDTELDAGGFPNYTSENRSKNWDTDHDGLPNWWEKAQGLNENSVKNDFSDANKDDDKNGYTQLEEYLHWMAQPHYFVTLNESLNLSLIEYFKGFEMKPAYSFSKVMNGNVTLKNDKLLFKSIKQGLASFEVSVKDAEGDTMTRLINVYIQ